MIKKLLASEIFRGVFTLSAGTMVAQVIPVLVQMYLRRTYEAEVFGAFAVFLTVVGIIIVIASLRYELAIVLPEKDEEASALVFLSLLLSFFFNLIVFVILLFTAPFIGTLLNLPQQFHYWLYFIPLSAFLLGSFQAFNYFLIRKKAFRASALNKVWRRSAEGIVNIISGIKQFPTGLVYGDIAGNLVNVISGIYQCSRKGFSLTGSRITEMKRQAVRYKSFPLFQAFPSLLNTFAIMAPVLFISYIYSAADTGYFDLANNVLILPVSLLSAALSQVIMQRTSAHIQKRESILPLFKQIVISVSLISIPGIIIIIAAGESIFGLVFGSQWELSGYYSKILVIPFAIHMVVSPVSIILTVLEKLKTVAIWQILYFAAVSCMLFADTLTLEWFLIIFSGLNVVFYLFYFLLIRNEILKYEKTIR